MKEEINHDEFSVLQGGCWPSGCNHKSLPEVEYKLPNIQWSVGMARSSNNGSSEFFINECNNTNELAPNGATKHGYAVFGKVIKGSSYNVIKSIIQQPTQLPLSSSSSSFRIGQEFKKNVLFKRVYVTASRVRTAPIDSPPSPLPPL